MIDADAFTIKAAEYISARKCRSGEYEFTLNQALTDALRFTVPTNVITLDMTDHLADLELPQAVRINLDIAYGRLCNIQQVFAEGTRKLPNKAVLTYVEAKRRRSQCHPTNTA